MSEGRHRYPGRTAEPPAQGVRRDRAVLVAAAASVVGRACVFGSSTGVLIIAARALSKPELGLVAVVTLLSLFFFGVGDFGLGMLLMTRLPVARAADDIVEQRVLVHTTLRALVPMGALLAVVGGASAYALPWPSILGAGVLSGQSVRLSVFCMFVFSGVGIPAAIGGRIQSAMFAAGDAQKWVMAASVASLAATAGCAILHLPPVAFVVAISGTPPILGVMQSCWVLRRKFPELAGHVHVRRSEVLRYARSGLVYGVLALSTVISFLLDSLVVSAVLDASAAAVFAVAARLFGLVGTTASVAGQQMWPALSDAVARRDIAWIRSRFTRFLALSAGISSVVCLMLVTLGQPLIRLLAGSALVPPKSLLIAFGLYTVGLIAITQGSYILAAVEQVKVIAAVSALSALINLGASIALTKTFGIIGPVIGSLVGLLFLVIPVVALTRRELNRIYLRVGVAGPPI